ncbi:MAG: SoxR reducing system RseC family protein [Deltaproteobacteria bacterium]|nr:SoxR reducing system RseC family protein [Candidatus Zymogenaceae bacterium]
MIIEIGKVIEIKDGGAVVLVSRSAACAGCASKNACHAFGSKSEARIIVDNPIGAVIDDTVEIGVREGGLVAASFIVYILPVAALFVGAGLGTWIAGMIGIPVGGISAFMGLLFLGVGFVAIRLMDPYLKKKNTLMPRIIRIVEECR